jgi:hypothetical protein
MIDREKLIEFLSANGVESPETFEKDQSLRIFWLLNPIYVNDKMYQNKAILYGQTLEFEDIAARFEGRYLFSGIYTLKDQQGMFYPSGE